MSKRGEQVEVEAVEKAAVKTRVRKATKVMKADGTLIVKYLGGGGEEIQMPLEMVDQFALFGFEAFFGRMITTAVSVEKLQESINEAVKKLEEGKFPVIARKSGGEKVDYLAQAVAEVNGVSVEKAAAWLEKQPRGTKISLRYDSRVAEVLARIEPKKVKKDAGENPFAGLADDF